MIDTVQEEKKRRGARPSISAGLRRHHASLDAAEKERRYTALQAGRDEYRACLTPERKALHSESIREGMRKHWAKVRTNPENP
jgi:hypothetical protein